MSGFPNEAASEKLYFQRLREMDEELARQGVPIDEKLYRGLTKAMDEHRAWVQRRKRDATQRARTR